MLFDRNGELILDFAFKSFTYVYVYVCVLVCLMRIAAQAKEENDSVWTCITFPAGKVLALEGHVNLRHLESEIPGNFMLNSYRDLEGWMGGAGCPDVGREADSWGGTPGSPVCCRGRWSRAQTALLPHLRRLWLPLWGVISPNTLNILLGNTFYLIERKIKITWTWRVYNNAAMGEHVLLKK